MTITTVVRCILAPLLVLAAACGDDGGGGAPVDAGPDAPPGPDAICHELGLPIRPFAAGPYGVHRGDTADDFTIDLRDGTSWNLREQWSGCETYVFIPDTITVASNDASSIWAHDVDHLIAASPRNTHYFFVSRKVSGVDASLDVISANIDAALATLPPADAEHWRHHLHVARKPALDLDNWIDTAFIGQGKNGFAIDRAQRVRGVGMLADVTRYDASRQGWPWAQNLAYAANEAAYLNGEAERQAVLDADHGLDVPLWTGAVLPDGFAELDATLPDAATMATFDTLVVDVTQRCPNADAPELGNCGAWDYLAYLWVRDDASGDWIELARFITSYHRETHWTVDVSPMLAHLSGGGTRHFKWEWAPSWNTQPTGTQVTLHLANRGKGYRPVAVTKLFTGGSFDSHYNDGRAPVDVPIPADARKVELFTLVTGHGSNDDMCGEFCDHQHELTVGAKTYRKEFPMAGTDTGCMAEVADGMTPNQGGTWWFGRGGWCPGAAVTPWVIDITGDVTPGQTATIGYRGLFQNANPPDAGAANIVLTSYLVVSR
ncbi:MAG TPA: peptide-N-glycosidase F-related protein [Kofleriaceae bacterium]|nr:peptide-N-glycosidase F-related protein [Kofleriaceae bacterium]